MVTNILIHREFTNAYPAKFVIERRRVVTENANKPHGHGSINPDDFSPFPKNPVIARFFKEIGRAGELGSGVRNLYKYTRHYSGGPGPELIEDDIFKMIIPVIGGGTNETANETANETVNETVKLPALQESILAAMRNNNVITYEELAKFLNKGRATIHRHIQQMIDKGVIERIGSDKDGHWKILKQVNPWNK